MSERLKNAGGSPSTPAAPDHIQIQTVTGCNASCIYCPNGKTRRVIPTGRRMSWRLYRSIVDQCIALGIRRYSVYLMNEPLLDSDLTRTGLAEIWHGEHYADYRHRFASGDIKGMVCAGCRKQDGQIEPPSTGRAEGVSIDG